jgi:hypothetical protein
MACTRPLLELKTRPRFSPVNQSLSMANVIFFAILNVKTESLILNTIVINVVMLSVMIESIILSAIITQVVMLNVMATSTMLKK